ncbi:cyclin-D3-3-like [Bidens hawaiensis]|uniref:cyclin-D3-3-like n=1 Tax=Bidens hawaiensis TaxID=980011 RepID=UPI00404910B8
MMTILDSLHCEENHQWNNNNNNNNNNNHEQPLNNHTCLDDDDTNNINNVHQELSSLLSKQSNQLFNNNHYSSDHRRRDAAEWILTVVSHYSFTTLTVVLAVNYLDRFIDRFEELQIEKKPWMTQLAAVACLSIAAKVEETRVPLLLDLQIVGSKYVFEAKTVQKMEILILSTLEWKMNPVTPLSFIDYVTRRLGLKSYLSVELINRCECVLLCFLSDDRFRCHLPSVIATAMMVHVINSVEPCIGTEFQSQLLGILGINKEEVEECRKEIQEVTRCRGSGMGKRKFGSMPASPDDVMDLSMSSVESWSEVVVNPSVSSSPEPGAKKGRKGAP